MKVNEIFYSLQGEGFHTGRPAVFVRLSGCNLRCPFCDTKHDTGLEMSEEAIVAEVMKYPVTHVVVTGGEPSLQLTESLVDALHRNGRYVAVETNGTHSLPANIDWITLSPKDGYCSNAAVILDHADELKAVYDGVTEPKTYDNIKISHDYFLQPCDTGDPKRNRDIVQQTIEYIKAHPLWRLSLQVHKSVNIP